jgi:hypothetical protein
MVYLPFLVFTDSAVICMVPLPFIESIACKKMTNCIPFSTCLTK